MSKAEVFPLDIAALQPGDVVDVAKLQEITRERHGTDAYHFAVRRIAARIERERKAAGRPITVRQRKGALEICDASMQLKYAKRRAAETGRKLRRTMTVLVTTSVAELTDEEAKDYERLAMNTAARLVSFAKRGPKRIAAGTSSGASEMKALKERLSSKKDAAE